MNRYMLTGASQKKSEKSATKEEDLASLRQLKSHIKSLAQTASAQFSFQSFMSDGADTKQYFKGIFERLFLC